MKKFLVVAVLLFFILGCKGNPNVTDNEGVYISLNRGHLESYEKSLTELNDAYERFRFRLYGEDGNTWCWSVIKINAPHIAKELENLDKQKNELKDEYMKIRKSDRTIVLFNHNLKVMNVTTQSLNTMTEALDFYQTIKIGDLKGKLGDYGKRNTKRYEE
jgi:hypothetical protein